MKSSIHFMTSGKLNNGLNLRNFPIKKNRQFMESRFAPPLFASASFYLLLPTRRGTSSFICSNLFLLFFSRSVALISLPLWFSKFTQNLQKWMNSLSLFLLLMFWSQCHLLNAGRMRAEFLALGFLRHLAARIRIMNEIIEISQPAPSSCQERIMNGPIRAVHSDKE